MPFFYIFLSSFTAGSEAKLFDSLVNTAIPPWWDDIDSLLILERLTVLLYNKVWYFFLVYTGVFLCSIWTLMSIVTSAKFDGKFIMY